MSKLAMFRMTLRIILGKIGYFSAVALTCGSLVGIVAGLVKADVFTWFCLGSFIPWWPLLRHFSSVRYLRKVIGEDVEFAGHRINGAQLLPLRPNGICRHKEGGGEHVSLDLTTTLGRNILLIVLGQSE